MNGLVTIYATLKRATVPATVAVALALTLAACAGNPSSNSSTGGSAGAGAATTTSAPGVTSSTAIPSEGPRQAGTETGTTDSNLQSADQALQQLDTTLTPDPSESQGSDK